MKAEKDREVDLSCELFVSIRIGSSTSMAITGTVLEIISLGLIGAIPFFLKRTSYGRTCISYDGTILFGSLSGDGYMMAFLRVQG